jgi:hypothetical protein
MTANANCTDAALPICNRMTGRCIPDNDADMDGIPDMVETRIGTNPMNADSDMDGVPDGSEVGAGPAFMTRDTDMDGTIDALDNDDDGDGVLTRDERTGRAERRRIVHVPRPCGRRIEQRTRGERARRDGRDGARVRRAPSSRCALSAPGKYSSAERGENHERRGARLLRHARTTAFDQHANLQASHGSPRVRGTNLNPVLSAVRTGNEARAARINARRDTLDRSLAGAVTGDSSAP